MAFDLTKSYFNDIKERTLSPAANITEEGSCLVYVDDGTGEVSVQQSAGAASEQFAGFSITDALDYLTDISVETYPIQTAPFTIQLQNGNVAVYSTGPTTHEIQFLDITATVYYVENTDYSFAAPGDDTKGLITVSGLHAGSSVGDVAQIVYRYTLTQQQIIAKYHQRSVNNFAQSYFGLVSVGCMDGEIFTTMYDVTKVYAINTAIYTGPNGKLTTVTTGALAGRCTKTPANNGDGYLGCKYKTNLAT